MPSLSNLHNYIKKHPHYFCNFLIDIIKIWWWRLCGHPIVVLTTESGGLGDYFWIRSYYGSIREHYAPKQCHIIVIGMFQWYPVVYSLDANNNKNKFDIFRFFESPDNPLRIEALFFKLFKADVYVNFRTRHLKHLVKANTCYFGEGAYTAKRYYENANNQLINRWFTLPAGFQHTPPMLPITDTNRLEALKSPFVVVAEKGNTQGKMSDEQILSIVKRIYSQGHNIFFNGDCNHLFELLKRSGHSFIADTIIDGYKYPLTEYPTVIEKCRYVVTVNTLPYHIAIQLGKPCVVLSVNEYETIKLDAENQIMLFNDSLQQAFESDISTYQKDDLLHLDCIGTNRIVEAIDKINTLA